MGRNLGDDAGTMGSVYQIAGANYGESGIPDKWIKLGKFELIDLILDNLVKR